jgi:hypothetical protein
MFEIRRQVNQPILNIRNIKDKKNNLLQLLKINQPFENYESCIDIKSECRWVSVYNAHV